MRYLIRDVRRWGLRVAWRNLRFNAGYRLGGFTSAQRGPLDD